MPETTQPAGEPVELRKAAAVDDTPLTTEALAKAGEPRPATTDLGRSFAAEAAGEQAEPLFASGETARLRGDWDQIQASFVDEPRQAVKAADRLVAQSIKRMAEIFADEKARLEGQWDRDGEASTEDLRQALRRYRAFFGRVLSV